MKGTTVLLLLMASATASKLVGTEFVAPGLRDRKTAVVDETDSSPPDPSPADPSSGTPALTDAEVTEVQMLISLRDVVRLEAYVNSLMNQLNKRVFGDLENSLLINKFTQSYSMYETVLSVLDKYKANRPILESKAQYLVRAVGYSLEAIRRADDKFMQLVDPEGLKEVREHNRGVFLQVLENLKAEVERFADAVLSELHELFKGLEATHKNPLMSDLQKIHELVEACLALVVFKKATLTSRVQSVLDMRKLVLDNPKYNEHLKKIASDQIVVGRAAKWAVVASLLLAGLALK